MADAESLKEKVQKLFDSRTKAETELKQVQQKLVDAVDNAERRVRVERLVTSCEEAMTKAYSRHDQLYAYAAKTTEPEQLKAELEKWLNEVTVQNDAILKRAREYIDKCSKTDVTSETSKPATQKNSSKASHHSSVSKTSSQRRKDLLVAQHRREEIEKQNEVALNLARQKQELELNRLHQEKERIEREQKLQMLELEEENRK